jgi:hypothetical protein
MTIRFSFTEPLRHTRLANVQGQALASLRLTTLVLLWVATIVSCSGFLISCSAGAQSPVPAAAADDHATTEQFNALAHKLLESGVKANGLAGSGLTPWHLKIDAQYLGWESPKPLSGAVEQWSVAPDQWRRIFTGPPGMNFSEWSVSHLEKYQSKQGHDPFDAIADNLRFARPVIDPLAQAANIHPDYEMEIKRGAFGGITLSCVSVVNPRRYAPNDNPDELFPTYCFDQDSHLRLIVSGKTTYQFDDLQVFQGRAVAHDVKVRQDGKLDTEMKVSLLEPLADANADRVKPGKDAVAQPYAIEPGLPRPESVYQVAAALPIQSTGLPYRGTFNVPVLIRKDGTVKVLPGANIDPQDLKDAIQSAVARWKYKPYLVDGQPIEVQYSVSYVIDGKPFTPSSQPANPAWAAYNSGH